MQAILRHIRFDIIKCIIIVYLGLRYQKKHSKSFLKYLKKINIITIIMFAMLSEKHDLVNYMLEFFHN